MPLTQRPYSVNSFCVSKICFRSASIKLREGDFKYMNSQIKSWIFSDQLESPEEILLYRNRKEGGLGLIHIKWKATAELIRSFLETALIKNFRKNSFHMALFRWHILHHRDIPDPGNSPYLTNDLFNLIREVKEEGVLNLSHMKSGDWYRVLIENKVTMETDMEGKRILKPSKVESRNPDVDWPNTWSLTNMKGLNPTEKSFLWKMVNNLLPTQSRPFRLKIKNTLSDLCSRCNRGESDDLTHALITCSINTETSTWLMSILQTHIAALQPKQVVLLDLGPLDESLRLPLVWLISSTLSLVWEARRENKRPILHKIRSSLEAKVNILRKTRFTNAVAIIENFEGLYQ